MVLRIYVGAGSGGPNPPSPARCRGGRWRSLQPRVWQGRPLIPGDHWLFEPPGPRLTKAEDRKSMVPDEGHQAGRGRVSEGKTEGRESAGGCEVPSASGALWVWSEDKAWWTLYKRRIIFIS